MPVCHLPIAVDLVKINLSCHRIEPAVGDLAVGFVRFSIAIINGACDHSIRCHAEEQKLVLAWAILVFPPN